MAGSYLSVDSGRGSSGIKVEFIIFAMSWSYVPNRIFTTKTMDKYLNPFPCYSVKEVLLSHM